MIRLIVASIAAAAALAQLATPAYACPNGYKTVWIQGNAVCMLDASASGNLTTGGGQKAKIAVPAPRLVVR